MSKLWKVQMQASSVMIMLVGLRKLAVTYQKRWNGPAPSILAASISSFGTLCSAASSTTVMIG